MKKQKKPKKKKKQDQLNTLRKRTRLGRKHLRILRDAFDPEIPSPCSDSGLYRV